MAALMAAVTILSGCSVDEGNMSGKNAVTPIQEPSLLDFATSRCVQLQPNYEVQEGIVVTFELYSENPLATDGSLREDLSPVGRGIYVTGISEISRYLPTYVTELYLYSPNLFVPLLSFAKVTDGIASFSKMDVTLSIKENTGLGFLLSPEFNLKPIGKFLKQKSDFYSETASGNYRYDLINPDLIREIPSEVLTAIGLTFPEMRRAGEEYFKDACMTLKESAQVFVSPIHCGGNYNNSLSYVVYEGPKELNDLTESEKMELEIINILQNANVITNSFKTSNPNGLTPGHYVQLLYKKGDEYVKEFPAGAKIGWILHSNAFDEANFTVKDSYRAYSAPDWNDTRDSKSGLLTRTIIFSAEDKQGTIYHCIGFEDDQRGDDDANDVIIHVEINPVDAIDPPVIINPGEEVEETETKSGILAFEDKWPMRDDYDLNDVVVQYKSEITYVKKRADTQQDSYVTRVVDTFSILHTGAAYNNGFSYKVHLNPELLERVQVDGIDYTVVPDGDGFIIDLCANVKEVIEPWIYGTTPKVYSVCMEFAGNNMFQSEFAFVSAPYNPFIIPREAPMPQTEVHLPMYPPTERADRTLFGTGDDCSNGSSLWYVSGVTNQYPYAIHLAGVTGGFVVPKESKSIDVTYPRYINWVESNLTEDRDWYLYPAP